METMQETVEKFREAFRKLAEAFREMVVAAVKKFWNLIKDNLPAIQQIVIDYEKAERQNKQNQHIRSTWHIDRDTRKRSQVINNRPAFYSRKIIR